ncbi:MAG: hypothetical protein AAGA31_08695, partial [Bacteroidota bacterium]
MNLLLRLYRIHLLLFIFITYSQQVIAQQVLNLDFEELSVEGPSRPWGWNVYSFAPGVAFICDSLAAKSGKYSLKISNEEETNDHPFELSFFVEPNQILNRKITIAAWAKSIDFKGKAGINIKSVGSLGEEYGTLQEKNTEIQYSSEWRPYEIEIDLGLQPHSILVTLFFKGTGTVWFDNLELKINGIKVQEVPVAQKFSPTQFGQIEK